jgi:hypothetical protein
MSSSDWAFINDTEWRRRTQGVSVRRVETGGWAVWFPNGDPVVRADGEQARADEPEVLMQACDRGELTGVLELPDQ